MNSDTLIDNIFRNKIKHVKVSGLMICDITDHLPVFTLCDIHGKKNHIPPNPFYAQVRTEAAINNVGVVYTQREMLMKHTTLFRKVLFIIQ